MSNMKTEYNFENDIVIANYAYTQCENFIRSVEQKNDNNIKNGLVANEEYEDLYSECVDGFDYYIVGKVLSMAEHRKISFENCVEKEAVTKEDINQRAYQWLMVNAVYENYTMYILECFRQTFVKPIPSSSLYNNFCDVFCFTNWIKSIRNDNGTFTFFADTNQPLTVK